MGSRHAAQEVLAHVLSLYGRGEEADRVMADIAAGELSDAARADRTFKRSGNHLFTLGDAEGASVSTRISRCTPRRWARRRRHATPPQHVGDNGAAQDRSRRGAPGGTPACGRSGQPCHPKRRSPARSGSCRCSNR